MQSTNPVLTRSDTFSRNGYATFRTAPDPTAPSGVRTQYSPSAGAVSRPMTIDDVVARTGLLLTIAITVGALSWAADVGYGLAIVAAIVGFGLALVNSFKRVPSPPLIIAYATAQGVFLGAFSHALEASNPNLKGVALQAVAGTAIVFGVMLALYKSGKVRVTARSQRIMFGALLAFVGLQMLNMILWMFGAGVDTWGGGLGIGIGAIGVGLGAYMLAMDFDLVEQGVRNGAPEIEAWRASFGLMVTIVWLYVEMLRLLSALRGD
jgi:uncharacterized YccA/Bax inhibitor family protein